MICSAWSFNSSITRIFSWMLSFEFIAISTICFDRSLVSSIASWIVAVMVFCSSMLFAFIPEAVVISCILPVTELVVSTSFPIRLLLLTDSSWTVLEISSTPCKISFCFLCSSSMDPSASALNNNVIFPILETINKTPSTPTTEHIVSTFNTVIPFIPWTIVTIT